MYFDSLADFVAMGRHGLYVWTAYGVFLLIIIWNLIALRGRRKSAHASVRRELRRSNSQSRASADRIQSGNPLNAERGDSKL